MHAHIIIFKKSELRGPYRNVAKEDSQCFVGSLRVMAKAPTRSLNLRFVIWVQPGLEPVLRMEAHNCGDCPRGSSSGGWGVQPAVKAPEEPVEEWKAKRVERQDAASLDEENHPFGACSPGHGRRCSAPGHPLQGKGPQLVGSGNAVGRQMGN